MTVLIAWLIVAAFVAGAIWLARSDYSIDDLFDDLW